MKYTDVIEGLVKNGATSNIGDHVSCLFEITKLMYLQYYNYVVQCIVYSIIYNILSSLRPTNQNCCIKRIVLRVILHE